MTVGGEMVFPRSPRQMMRHGLAFVPEDRQGSGLIMPWAVFSNITLPILGRISSFAIFPARRKEEAVAGRYVNALDIRPSRVAEPVANLSGGNQQKVLLSKWLATDPRILILEDPTAGIDIGAKAEVHRLIGKLADDGLALIIVSSDLSELLSITHRILVFAGGRVVADLPASEASRESIMRAATDAWTQTAPGPADRRPIVGASAR